MKKLKNVVLLDILIFFILMIRLNGAYALEANNSCIDCHKAINPYTEEQTKFNDIIINHTERNVSCSLDCHKDTIRQMAIDNYKQWSNSVHSGYFVTCDKCHGGDPRAQNMTRAHVGILNSTDTNSSVYFSNIPQTCGKCHSDELKNFEDTMHFQRLRADSLAPSCITCHTPHTFHVPNTIEITKLCSICHNPTNLPSLASIPKDAKTSLDKVNYLNNLLIEVNKKVNDAKNSSLDTKAAQNDLDNALEIADNIPSIWHKFNLQNFDQYVQNGIDYAEKARDDLQGSNQQANVKAAPNVPIIMIFGIFVSIYWFRKKIRK